MKRVVSLFLPPSHFNTKADLPREVECYTWETTDTICGDWWMVRCVPWSSCCGHRGTCNFNGSSWVVACMLYLSWYNSNMNVSMNISEPRLPEKKAGLHVTLRPSLCRTLLGQYTGGTVIPCRNGSPVAVYTTYVSLFILNGHSLCVN